ncbi:hypothetical protein [Nocardia sp. NBC_01327]|uniref:hypothetical protein n=1 Tax=Nocardia sp. NBC_01327 TaxID=2903593 RepID=UPI002E119339|nr:hypothetical protein OG326_23900 [Nocardia sp. NBC_01327]
MGTVFSRNAKAVVSAIGGVLAVLASVAALAQYAPVSVWAPAGGVLTALEALRTANIWFVRNEPAIEQAVGEAGDLVDTVGAAVHPTGAAPAPAAGV